MTAIRADFRFSTGSNALIKTWGSAISSALSGIGLVKASDTGQINWSTTTVTASAADQLLGYEIWHFNDAQQSLQPVFIRIEYKTSPSSTTVPSINVYTGSATDGAGNLSGLVTPVRGGTSDSLSAFSHPAASLALTPTPHFFSGDGSSFAMALCPDDSGTPGSANTGSVWYWFVERTRDLDGAYNANGWIYGCILTDRQGSIYFTRYAVHSGLAATVWGSNFYAPIPYTGNTYGGSMGPNSVFTTYPWLVGLPKPQGQSLTTMAFQNGLSSYQTTQLVVYGATHTYIALPGVVGAMPGAQGETNGASQNWCTLLMRYE